VNLRLFAFGLYVFATTAWSTDQAASRIAAQAVQAQPRPDVQQGSAQCAKLAKSGMEFVGATPGTFGVKLPPLVVEAESLLTAGKVKVNGGNLAIQQMAPFGPGWGGDAQLFWSGGSIGAVLDATVQLTTAGQYDVDVYLTRAPDYAQVATQVKGAATWLPGHPLDGWGPSVTAPSYASPLGQFALVKGDNQLSLMITGKNAQSSGYLVGIDCLAFRFIR